ncbi:hypothetical protein [Streptomyces sp. NBC_01262]|uniref:hypothetical protein n=1 Tax=Streptomyces sp. NBC_01262 TaxID=2903803 RepID=UPI002E3594EC|nr:hypothetical protein [Streptomyces sp. NBC_01262]
MPSFWPRPPLLSHTRTSPRAPRGCRRRLVLPPDLPAALGCDAVGIPAEHGQRIIEALPRIGCVFADERRWWWIVPSGSHLGVTWPGFTQYAVGARLATPPGQDPRLIHRPHDSPYTSPLPLYFVTCHLGAGTGPGTG